MDSSADTRTASAALVPSSEQGDASGSARAPSARPIAIALGLGVAAATILRFSVVPIYLPGDAGHYLADADAVFGDGVRESRHLPLYPMLLGALRLVVGDLEAVTLGMAFVIVLLALGFYTFIRGRTGSPVAELVGTAFFVASPLIAEGVGWYGASMLLGLALSLFAMRWIDEAMSRPSRRRVVVAGVTSGLVGLAHPLAFALLAQVSALVLTVLAIRALRRAPSGAAKRSVLFRHAAPAGAVAAIAAVLASAQLGFYSDLQSPVSVDFDPARPAAVWRWAFREDAALWALVVVLGAALLVPGARRLTGEAGLRFGLWSAVVGAVALGNIAVGGGQPSYTTRNIYALPVALAATVAVVVALASRLPPGTPSRWRAATHVLVALVVLVSGVRVGQAHLARLDVAIPYYSSLSPLELDAIAWLQGRRGTVAVTAKGGDKNAGTLYAWMIEGLARMRAVGTGDAFLALLERARQDSLDVERMVSGSAVTESASLRVSRNAALPGRADVAGLVDGDWFPLVTISAGSYGAVPGDAAAAAPAGARSADPARQAELRTRVRRAGDQVHLVVDVAPSHSADAVSVDVEPSRFTSAVLRADGGRSSIAVAAGERDVELRMETEPSSPSSVEHDARSTAARVHVESPGPGGLRLRLAVSNLDPPRGPEVSYRDADLIRKLGVRYLFTWRESEVGSLLAGRRCFREATGNREVLVFEVVPACRAAATPVRAER